MPLFSEATRTAMLLRQLGAVTYTTPTSWQIALIATAPDDLTGTGLVELSGSGYSRVLVAASSSQFVKSANGPEVVNKVDWRWPIAGEDWGTAIGIALYDNTGAYQGYTAFSTPVYIASGATFIIKAGSAIFAAEDTPLSVTVLEANVPIIRTSPAGNRFALGVSDAGALTATATTAFGPPTPPQSLTRNATTRALTWTAPVSTGGTPVISYTCWIHDTATGLIVTETISPDVLTYTPVYVASSGYIYLTAENFAGSSDPSAVVTAGS